MTLVADESTGKIDGEGNLEAVDGAHQLSALRLTHIGKTVFAGGQETNAGG